MAWRQASCATICAAYAVLLREPLNPTFPALDQPMTLPRKSVIVTMVLLKVANTCAMPLWTPLAPLARTIFGPSAGVSGSSETTGAASLAGSAAAAGVAGFFVEAFGFPAAFAGFGAASDASALASPPAALAGSGVGSTLDFSFSSAI